jgi:hypothetical protein
MDSRLRGNDNWVRKSKTWDDKATLDSRLRGNDIDEQEV